MIIERITHMITVLLYRKATAFFLHTVSGALYARDILCEVTMSRARSALVNV